VTLASTSTWFWRNSETTLHWGSLNKISAIQWYASPEPGVVLASPFLCRSQTTFSLFSFEDMLTKTVGSIFNLALASIMPATLLIVLRTLDCSELTT